ncbi:hypothetical protein [Streptomyces sp. NPDC054838]
MTTTGPKGACESWPLEKNRWPERRWSRARHTPRRGRRESTQAARLAAFLSALADHDFRRGALARFGSPAVPGQTVWPATGAGTGTVRTLDPVGTRTGTSFAADHRCAFWRTRPAGPPL